MKSVLLWTLILALLIAPSHAQEPRYLVLRQRFVFSRQSELPYRVLRPMCWQDAGYCDLPLEHSYGLYEIVDLSTGHLAYVMHSDSGCYVWWMRDDIGIDGMPHIAKADWIACDTETS